jgi:predicted ATPase
MITKLVIKNLKRFETVEFPLADVIIFAGPNNSGKSTAIQALTLWYFCLQKWLSERGEDSGSKAKDRPGVPLTRKELTVIPARSVRQLWHDCIVALAASQVVPIQIIVSGIDGSEEWTCGVELRYQSTEQFYTNPISKDNQPLEVSQIPKEVRRLTVAHLPPLAGLQREEEKLEEGAQNRRIGEGRAGDILRNLVLTVYEQDSENWKKIQKCMADLFQVELLDPEHLPQTSEIILEYRNLSAKKKKGREDYLDIATGGSGFHQVLLLLAFIYARPGSVLLLDEPDAHLEIIRQRQLFSVLRQLVAERGSQLVVATHSEVIFDECEYDQIVAFLGPRVGLLKSSTEKTQVKKSLQDISNADYLLAEQKHRVLYVEDFTDLDILEAWAQVLKHPAAPLLENCFVKHIGNVITEARKHFHGLKVAIANLKGFVLIDQSAVSLENHPELIEKMWQRREIENYLLNPAAITRTCNRLVTQTMELFGANAMKTAEEMLRKRMTANDYDNPLIDSATLQDIRGSEFLDSFFRDFFGEFDIYNPMPKREFYQIAASMTQAEIHPEVVRVLDSVAGILEAKC